MSKIKIDNNAFTYPMPMTLVGAMVGAYADAACLTDGKPDVTKIEPFMLTMPGNGYCRVGAKVGTAWSIGKKVEG